MIYLVSIMVIIIGLPVLLAWLDEFFTPNWDSIYDPRSKYQQWRDNKKTNNNG